MTDADENTKLSVNQSLHFACLSNQEMHYWKSANAPHPDSSVADR